MNYVLGIDIGTSSIKGIVLNKKGEIIGVSSNNYPLIQEKNGYSEQNPECWINGFENIIEDLSFKIQDFKENLEGISFSGQMHSLVLLGEKNEILRNAILWNDVRTTKECEFIMRDKENLLKITKNKALEGFTLPKILWVQKNEKEIWEKVRHILLPKDYLSFYLSGEYVTDYSDASGTLLLDMNVNKWSEYQLEKYNIPIEYMPKLLKSHEFIGELKENLKEKYQLKKNIKLFAGGADNACAALTTGISDEKTAMMSIGTSGVFLGIEKNLINNYNAELHVFNHVIENKYYSMGVTLSAGHSLEWFKNTFAKDSNFEELLKDINTVKSGSEGLLFTPYIVGERTPYTDSNIRGSFIGIDTKHRVKHFSRAILEGITFSLKDSYTLMKKIAKKNFNTVISVGGGAKNKDWLQLQANIFNLKIKTLNIEQGPCLGAAMLASLGLNWYENFESCMKSIIKYKNVYSPQEDEVLKYENIYSIYTKIYHQTKVICDELKKGLNYGENN